MKKNFTSLLVGPFLFSLLFLSATIIPQSAMAQPASQTFNSSGTYVVPAGYTVSVVIQAWGGGGGGGNNTDGAKGGGGGGSYASSVLTLSAGSYTVTVGAGGGPGSNGGSSSFLNTVIAEGGGAASGASGGSSGSSTGSTGTIVVESTSGMGKDGDNGGAGGAGANGGGAGGAGGVANDGSGTSGSAPGGGGGGKAGPGGFGISGNGAAGRVVVTLNMVLAVNFSVIKAYEKQNGVQIDWTVNSESNLDKYQVERSADGINFNAIGTVASRNVSAETSYSYIDVSPMSNVSYYRIRSMSFDGKSTFSHIIKVNLNKTDKAFSVYPNPAVASGFISLQCADLAKGVYSLKLLNAAGLQVSTSSFTHNGGAVNQSIQLPVVTAGMYSIQLNNEVSRVMGKIIMVQ